MTAPLTRARRTSVEVVRPMFQVLRDDSQTCCCHLMRTDDVCNVTAMHVGYDEYARPDRIWL